MKKIVTFVLLLFFFAISASFAQSRDRNPRRVTKTTFAHNSESRKGRTEHTQFRRENRKAYIDLNPGNQEKFKSTRAAKPYKFSKGK